VGFVANTANRVREFFRQDKEQLALRMAKGTTSAGYPSAGYDMLQAYGYDVLSDYLRLEHDLLSRFVDYEEMDDYPEISTAIDIYSDDASQPETQLNRTVWVESQDESVQKVLDDLLHKTLRIDEEIWEIARTLCKYGNDCEELLVTERGVEGLNFLPPPTVRRIEGPRGELFGFVQDFKGKFGYCLARGSRIWKVGGLVEVQNFKDGDVVAAHKNGQQVPLRVKKLHHNGTKRVFKLRTRHRELFLTENHPVLVQRLDGTQVWTQVKDLKLVRFNGKKQNIDYSKSDKLVISTRMPVGELPEWASLQSFDPFAQTQGNKGSPVALTLPPRPSPEFCNLFGFLLGDGWLEEDRRVSYARGVYPELNDKYDSLLRSFGVEAVVSEDGTQTRVASVHLARLLQSLGWINGASKKRVPGWVFGLPESHREALLRGFLDADGWVQHQPTRQYDSHSFEIANYDLARDLKNLIDGLGYRCGNVGTRTRKVGGIINGKTVKTQQACFNLTFTEHKFDQQFVAENLLNLSYYEDTEVYDLEVEDAAHNFVTDGVVVHNSPQEFQQILASRAAMRLGGTEKQGMGGLDRIAALEDWEVVHFRLRGKHRRSLYGYSVLESSRWIWKRLMMLEDAALIYRLQRAPERYAFYVDVGDLPPAEALAFVNRVRQGHKKTKYFNPTCLTADTCITCLDGVERSIGELARDYADKTFDVFSYDLENGRVVPGKASGPRKTGEQVPVWRVVLDNGAVVRSTGNHPFLMRDGTYRAANTLVAGDSLMPLYMSRGYECSDYWMYEDPASGQRKHVHKMVAEAVYGAEALHGLHVHHKDENKANNTPANLEALTASEHMRRHPENAMKGRAAYVARIQTDAAFAKAIVSRMDEYRDPVTAGRRSQELRSSEARGGQARLVELLTSEVVRDPLVVVEEMLERLNANEEFKSVYAALPTTQKSEMSVGCFHAFIQRQGFEGFKDFKTKKCGEAKWVNRTYGAVPTADKKVVNHKVISVSFDGYEDVYNLDVETYHNFALTAGVFTHNTGKLDLKFNPISQDEDFFVPSRKGQDGTRIEVLGSPSWQHMDDIEYFRDKLFAALKVPKAYMGQQEGVARAVLSSEDVRFARTVLRVQREIRNGLAKVCRIHLAALNIDPYAVDYDIKMTVPSSIFELAQLEVRNARADLAGRMGQFVSLHWTLANVFGFSDHDIEEIISQQEEDALRVTMNQTKAEIAAQKYQQEHAPAPPPDQAPGQAAPPPDQEQPQADQEGDLPPADGVQLAPDTVAADAPPPPAAKATNAQKLLAYRSKKYPLNQSRRVRRTGIITEQELFAGSNKENEKRAMDKLETLLKNDKQLAVRLLEVRSLLDDVRSIRGK
jgi:intein/homing endonuclease